MSDFTKFFNKWPKYLVERPPDAQAPLHYKTSHNHTFSFEQKSYLKLYYVSILPNQAPTVSQMDQDLLDNNRKDEYKAACWELRGKYELRILIWIVCHLGDGDVKMQWKCIIDVFWHRRKKSATAIFFTTFKTVITVQLSFLLVFARHRRRRSSAVPLSSV